MILLKDTYFDLFHLPKRFSIDIQALDNAYRVVQKQVHPDRFASTSDMQKSIAIKWSTHTNEAYRTLYDPLKRAIYMLMLRGIDIGAETKIVMDPMFLAQQVEWYKAVEDLSSSNNIGALKELLVELKNEENIRLDRIGKFLDSNANHDAEAVVRQMIFIERVILEADSHIERLQQYVGH